VMILWWLKSNVPEPRIILRWGKDRFLTSARRRLSSEVMHFHYEGHWGT
jgi:hypothetical protein